MAILVCVYVPLLHTPTYLNDIQLLLMLSNYYLCYPIITYAIQLLIKAKTNVVQAITDEGLGIPQKPIACGLP